MAESYVQVVFEGETRSYTYQDVQGKLQLGDQFAIDPDNQDFRVVTVVGTTRGYDGNVKQINVTPIKTIQT